MADESAELETFNLSRPAILDGKLRWPHEGPFVRSPEVVAQLRADDALDEPATAAPKAKRG